MRTRSGKLKNVTLTVYEPNATRGHLPVSLKLSYSGLKPGRHTLSVKITYRQAETERRRTTKTRTQTLKTNFTIC